LKTKNKGVAGIPKKSSISISILMYGAALVVAIIGIVLLVDNIYIFRSTVGQYVAQGYAASDVMKSLVPSQLIPGIIQAVAGYGGIAMILIGLGVANNKISSSYKNFTETENHETLEEKSTLEQEESITETEETITKTEEIKI
jgi:hypothetical protein